MKAGKSILYTQFYYINFVYLKYQNGSPSMNWKIGMYLLWTKLLSKGDICSLLELNKIFNGNKTQSIASAILR